MMIPNLPVLAQAITKVPLSYVGVRSFNMSSATSTSTLIPHTSTAIGDTVVVFVTVYDRTITTPSGTTAVFSNANPSGSRNASCFYYTYSSGSIDVTCSGVPTSGKALLVTLRGGSGFDTHSVTTVSSGGSVTIPSLTVAQNNSFVIAFASSFRNDSTVMSTSFSAPYTEVEDVSMVNSSTSTTGAAATRSGVSSGTLSTTTVTSSAASAMVGSYIVFKDIT